MSIKDAIQTVLTRNDFYRDGYRFLLKISLVQGLVIVVMGAALLSLILSVETRNVYFATTSDGRIIHIVPLHEPFRQDDEVIAWVVEKTKEIMLFGYNDFRPRLQKASENFTPRGWESFTKAMQQARILEAIEARKLTVKLDISAAPEIRSKKVVDGVYQWVMSFPVTISFDGNEPPQPMAVNLHLLVTRVSTLQNPAGIGIERWIADSR